ncbi:hypothetical protein FRC04_001696 [Tulasnella sp. 424]|nr:hypothetical protein FRC04_001696 [Tulasnella sp. 424]
MEDKPWVRFVTLGDQKGGQYRRRSRRPTAHGGFSDIWQCDAIFSDGSKLMVAVKTLRAVALPSGDEAQITKTLLWRLEKELRIWMQLQHTNIAPLLGFTFGDELVMISPWFSHGDVSKYLDAHPEADRMKLVQGVAAGLEYLHSSSPVVVHGDMKPDNVMIDQWGCPRIIDFGLSEIDEVDLSLTLLQSDSRIQDAGSPRWMAPELLLEEGTSRSRQTDMFGFGCIAFFIFTGDVPFKGIDGRKLWLARFQGASPIQDGATYPNLNTGNTLMEVLRACWNPDPQARPKIGEVAKLLNTAHPGSTPSAPAAPQIDDEQVSLLWRLYGEELPVEVAPRRDDPSWETFRTIVMGLDGMFRREGELNSEAYGSYADVSKTEAWFEGRIRVEVAVKRLRFLGIQDPHRPHASEVSQKCKKRLDREVRMWMGLRHPNIAPLLGYGDSRAFYMISPWFHNGNISEYLRRKNPEEHERVVLVSQIASGLAYLHGLSPPVVHGDIKPDNIVVDKDGRPQIIDFGLSKAIEEESGPALQISSSFQGAGNVRWVAPELLIQAGKVRAASSDVFSFGCVALFAMTGDLPFADGDANEFQVCYVRSQGAQPVRSGVTYACFEQRLVLKELLHKCWAVAAEDRPTMVAVHDALISLG